MSKTVYLQAYFNTLHSLLDDLLRVFPNDTDLVTFKTSLSMIQKTNPMMLIRNVHETMSPYQEMIKQRNTDFFLKFNYDEFAKTDQTLGPLLEKLKTMWNVLTPTHQKVVWEYITNLSGLVNKCIE